MTSPISAAAKHPATVKAEQRRAQLLAEMNDKHAVVDRNGTACVVTFAYNPGLRRKVVYYSSFQDIANLYSHQYITVGEADSETGAPKATSKSLGSYWLRWPGRRRYEGVTFAPGRQLGDRYLNLWQGWAVEPKAGDWSKFRNLIHDVICSGNEEHYRYLLNWMARAVQQPGEPGEVAVVLQGERGVGKGTFIDTFGQLFGPHYLQIASAQHLTGQFNAHLETCALLFLDEALWAGDHQGENTLKALITERTIAVRPMRTNMYQAPNCLHIMMATNSEWAFPAGPKERRAFVLEVSSKHIQNTGYFGAIRQEMANGGLEAMLFDLLKRDISTFDVRASLPQTDALREQQVLSLSPAETWWYDKLVKGELHPSLEGWQEEIAKEALHEDYCKQMGLIGVKRRVTTTALGILLGKLVPRLKRRRDRWYVPPLQECREAWDRLMRTTTRWDEELEEAA